MKNLFGHPLILAIVLSAIFFIFGIFTLNNYGVSWDEPTHFKRGQGYLWFLLTGDNDYHRLPPYDLSSAQNNPKYHQRSIYQSDLHNAAFYRAIDGTHPPLADILASVTNMVFYQSLGWVGDIESYHLFEIFVASVAVGILFLFVLEGFGPRAAFFSTILFTTYPIFWAEAHFNIKDPIETSWIILTLFFLWKGISTQSARLLLLSSVFAGFALSTKFNAIFLPFIVFPWLLLIFLKHKKELVEFARTRKFILTAVVYPIVAVTIFYISYPFLWENPIVNIGKVFTFYQRNALDPAFANAVLPSWSFYALRWVILTAPPLVLMGFALSLLFAKSKLLKNHGFILLILLWFVVTIVRVSLPGINIYGGVRQIMEYIPALAILAGIGLSLAIEKLKIKFKHKFKNFFLFDLSAVILTFAFSIYPIIKLHPNENVYFNFIAGGLQGALKAGVPAAGNSFGNAYNQGVLWINTNASKGAKLALLQGAAVNIPKNKLRSDIDLSSDHFSGIGRAGEYLMELTFNWEHRQNYYAWEYVDRFLEPLYEVKVDSVPILKIWKNDLEHTRSQYQLEEKNFEGKTVMKKDGNKLIFEAEKELSLSRIILSYDPVEGCSPFTVSGVETSSNGKQWMREKDPLTFLQVGKRPSSFRPAWESLAIEAKSNPPDKVEFYFAGRKAQFIRFVLDDEVSCALNNPTFEIKVLVPILTSRS